MIKFTDTHTHLYLEQFDNDRDNVINEAIKQNVDSFFLPAINASYTGRMEELKYKYPNNIFLMAGLHPMYVNENWEEKLVDVKSQLDKKNHFVAVGEIGIDLYWNKNFFKEQRAAFYSQIQFAKEFKLPIVIHCREAFEEIIEVLEIEKNQIKGIFHCFSGTLEQAKKIISLGFILGIGGVLTFKNSKIDNFLNQIDLQHLVLETDAPYLAPVPYRGKRNESKYIVEIAKKLTFIYNKSMEEIATITTQNSKKIFNV